ncbi:Short-chain dehydrogenase/reductase SDR [Fusarium oxysporum f. sp. vasinfectum]|nr:Short-chain dehydrogenase/reductase SDR [Fusarium oxysporum f. sp. vasinfectum]
MTEVIIVTGASRGIGHAICCHLLSNPTCKVFAVARQPEPLQKLHLAYPDRMQYLCGDLADPAFGMAVVTRCLTAFGHINGVAVNHAIIEPVGVAADIEVADWMATFNVNFFGSVALRSPALRQARGRIIITQSHSINRYYRGWGPYGASKAALHHYAGTLTLEEPLINVLGIVPGMVDTAMSKRVRERYGPAMDAGDHQSLVALYETSQMVKPEQPGGVIAELALRAPATLRGKFLDWDDHILEEFK